MPIKTIQETIHVPFSCIGSKIYDYLLNTLNQKYSGHANTPDSFIQTVPFVKILDKGKISRIDASVSFPVQITLQTRVLKEGDVVDAVVVQKTQWGVMMVIDHHVQCLVHIPPKFSLPRGPLKEKIISIRLTTVKQEHTRLMCTGVPV